MELEGIGEVEEVPAQQQLMPPEEVIQPTGFGVRVVDTPEGQLTVLTFVTPFKHYSFKLNDDAAKMLSEGVLPSQIVRATPLDLPPGARG